MTAAIISELTVPVTSRPVAAVTTCSRPITALRTGHGIAAVTAALTSSRRCTPPPPSPPPPLAPPPPPRSTCPTAAAGRPSRPGRANSPSAQTTRTPPPARRGRARPREQARAVAGGFRMCLEVSRNVPKHLEAFRSVAMSSSSTHAQFKACSKGVCVCVCVRRVLGCCCAVLRVCVPGGRPSCMMTTG